MQGEPTKARATSSPLVRATMARVFERIAAAEPDPF
jgi:hypothetical protein